MKSPKEKKKSKNPHYKRKHSLYHNAWGQYNWYRLGIHNSPASGPVVSTSCCNQTPVHLPRTIDLLQPGTGEQGFCTHINPKLPAPPICQLREEDQIQAPPVQVQVSALSLLSSMTFGRFLTVSVPQFLHLSLSLFLFFLGPHLWHPEVPRLEVESELQLLADTTPPRLRSELSLQPMPQLAATLDP